MAIQQPPTGELPPSEFPVTTVDRTTPQSRHKLGGWGALAGAGGAVVLALGAGFLLSLDGGDGESTTGADQPAAPLGESDPMEIPAAPTPDAHTLDLGRISVEDLCDDGEGGGYGASLGPTLQVVYGLLDGDQEEDAVAVYDCEIPTGDTTTMAAPVSLGVDGQAERLIGGENFQVATGGNVLDVRLIEANGPTVVEIEHEWRNPGASPGRGTSRRHFEPTYADDVGSWLEEPPVIEDLGG